MKRCPFCGAQIADGCLFCTECGKELPKSNACPNCGASVNEGDVFCSECGKRIDEIQPIKPKCPHCGASMNDGDDFCSECGKKNEEEEPQSVTIVHIPCPHCGELVGENDIRCDSCGALLVEGVEDEYEKKTLKDYMSLIIGAIVVVLLLVCGMWYYNSSTQRFAREKAIADSLEVVRQDSIKKADLLKKKELLAAEKEKHIEACKAFLDKFYNGLEGSQNVEEYVSNYITDNARKILIEEFDYDCNSNDCLAIWLFSYDAGSDTGPLRERTIEMEDENTFTVNFIYELGNGGHATYDGYTAYEYVVRLGIVQEGNSFKINKIERVSGHPIVG